MWDVHASSSTSQATRYMDPLVRVFEQNPATGRFHYLCQTEPARAPTRQTKVENRQNPAFPGRLRRGLIVCPAPPRFRIVCRR